MPIAGSLVFTWLHRRKHGLEHDDYDLSTKVTPPGTPKIPPKHK